MKKWTLMTLALAVSLTAACVSPQQDDPWNIEECADAEKCEEQNDEEPAVSGTYVSGHLGNYRDCPGDGYSPQSSDSDGDAGAGACAPGTECEWNGNCEDAQLTVRLTNTGEGAVHGLQVATIELFDADGVSQAVLPLMQTVVVGTGEAFDGELEAGEETMLRVEFQGPEAPDSLLNTESTDGDFSGDRSADNYGTIDMTFTADNHDDVVIETTALYPVPSVDT